MKNVLVILGLSLLIYGCGKSDSNNSSNGGTAVVPNGQCIAGQVYTQYGCLPQGNCQVGQAQYANTCVPATGYGVGGGYGASCQGNCQVGQVQTQWGCLPQNTSCGTCGALINNQCVQGYSSGYNGYSNGYYGNGGGYYGGGGYYNTDYYRSSRCTYSGWYWYCY